MYLYFFVALGGSSTPGPPRNYATEYVTYVSNETTCVILLTSVRVTVANDVYLPGLNCFYLIIGDAMDVRRCAAIIVQRQRSSYFHSICRSVYSHVRATA